MAEDQKRRSIEDALPAVEAALRSIKPKDASLWALVQASRELIREKKIEGARWAEIAAGFRVAGFPTATESNVRLAYQSREPLKKVAKARRRREKTQQLQKNALETTKTQSPETGTALLGNIPRKLKDRYAS
jgi:hypothetical protein